MQSRLNTFDDALTAALTHWGISVEPNRLAQLRAHYEAVVEANRSMNLTRITEPIDAAVLHYADSLALLSWVEKRKLTIRTVLDVGTGAGFPGLPLAIAEPDRMFDLVDSNGRKIQFIKHVTGLLGLRNVAAVKTRTEDYAPGYRFDTVIARAVAALPRLAEIAGHHVGEHGVFVALKGRLPAEECEHVPDTWQSTITELSVPGLEAGSRHAVLMRRK